MLNSEVSRRITSVAPAERTWAVAPGTWKAAADGGAAAAAVAAAAGVHGAGGTDSVGVCSRRG